MKKSFLFGHLILWFLASVLNGQLISSVTVKSGLIFAKQNWKGSDQPEYRRGLAVALDAECFRSPHSSFVAEVAYLQKGFKYLIEETNETYPDGTGKFFDVGDKLKYLSVSLLGKVRTNFGSLSPYGVFGPRLDFELSKKVYLSASQDSKALLMGYSFGGGVEISKIIKNDIVVEGIVSPDLTRVNKAWYKPKNFSIQTVIGIVF